MVEIKKKDKFSLALSAEMRIFASSSM